MKNTNSKIIHETLAEVGLPSRLLGYVYITESLEWVIEKPEYLRYITKGLYVDLAKQYNSTPGAIERAIRHAISVLWVKGNESMLQQIFKGCYDKAPTNSLFLSTIYFYLTKR